MDKSIVHIEHEKRVIHIDQNSDFWKTDVESLRTNVAYRGWYFVFDNGHNTSASGFWELADAFCAYCTGLDAVISAGQPLGRDIFKVMLLDGSDWVDAMQRIQAKYSDISEHIYFSFSSKLEGTLCAS